MGISTIFQPFPAEINPMHTVPAIKDDGFILWDSLVIMKYLANQYGKDDSLYPRDVKRAALVDQRLQFVSTFLFPNVVGYATDVISGGTPDPEKLKKSDEGLRILDDFLKNQMWVAGSNMTIADFSVITVIATAEAVMFEIENYPNIWTWYELARKAMTSFGYEEINQSGANTIGALFKSKLKTLN